jgi:hypothetical protein
MERKDILARKQQIHIPNYTLRSSACEGSSSQPQELDEEQEVTGQP